MKRLVSLDVLDRIGVASPCAADWGAMSGGDRVRRCGACGLHVHNLSDMTREDAAALIGRTEGRLCVRLYRRADGTTITRDCPVGVRGVRRRVAAGIGRAAAAAALVAGSVAALGVGRAWWARAARLRNTPPFSTVCAWFSPAAPWMLSRPTVSMGIMIVPARTGAPSGSACGGASDGSDRP
jgi:hypothetical protein